jgi:tetratricopeptide (TPR) repeat protein
MARQKKRWRRKHGKAKHPESTEELASTAAEHLDGGRFKDAVDDYKRLVKAERREQWVDGLAQAYAGRAEQLASQGMIKEAIVLWHNRAETCDRALADPRYLEWLLADGRTAEAMRLYIEDSEALAGAAGPAQVQAQLAAAALANGGGTLKTLSTDDPLARDFAAADAALQAYSQGDDNALDAALSRIPFRSPYRDLRQLLKAMLRLEQEPDAAAQLLARVPADTAFAGLRSAVEAAAPTGRPLWPRIAELPAEILDVAAALAGWSKDQVKSIAILARLEPAPNRPALLKFILGHRQTLGEPFAGEAAFTVTGPEPRLYRRLDKAYRDLSPAEKWRLRAQAAEVEGDFPVAGEQWLGLADALAAQPDSADNRLRRALIHRHIADMIQPASSEPPLNSHVVRHLEQSLDLDPEDRESVLRLLDHNLHVGNLKAARQWVDYALAQHPDDAECLLKAAQTAVAGGAYKKAARFAHRLLEIDPINPRVRGLLVDSHFAHARKQIRAGRHAAARTELEHAAEWTRSAIDAGRGQILHGLIALDEDISTAREALRAGIERAGGGLVGRFYLLLEAYRSGRDFKSVTQAANLAAAKKTGDRDQVLALIRTVNGLREVQQDKPAVEAALEALAPAIDREAKAEFSRDELQLVCETLLRYRQYASLKRYAQAALRRRQRDPLLTFYKVQGQLKGREMRPWSAEFEQLETAYELAHATDDLRTGERINTELNKALPSLPALDMLPDPFLEDAEDEIDSDDSLAALLGGDPAAFIAFLEATLNQSDLHRLLNALEHDKKPPPDIMAQLEASLDERAGLPGASGPGRKPRKGKKRVPKARRRRSGTPFQDELFGD